MTLTTHAVVGAAVASLMPQYPALALCAAFASHFMIDAIPHRDYQIRSASIHPRKGAPMKYDRAFFLDAVTIGSDALFGILLALLFFLAAAPWWLIVLGACAGILPDPLQFVYAHWKHEPLVSLQRFHMWIHTKHRMKETPLLGISSQIFFVITVICVRVFL